MGYLSSLLEESRIHSATALRLPEVPKWNWLRIAPQAPPSGPSVDFSSVVQLALSLRQHQPSYRSVSSRWGGQIGRARPVAHSTSFTPTTPELGRIVMTVVFQPINHVHGPVAIAVVYEARCSTLCSVDGTEEP
jgi:hypothetical protein